MVNIGIGVLNLIVVGLALKYKLGKGAIILNLISAILNIGIGVLLLL
jgi:hypothetical protein